jgi:hypothetical protein
VNWKAHTGTEFHSAAGRRLDESSDQELALASCRGDRTAYAHLVRRHYKSVFLVCLGVLGNVHDAEDAAQDAMLKGFQQVRQLRDATQFGGWIVAVSIQQTVQDQHGFLTQVHDLAQGLAGGCELLIGSTLGRPECGQFGFDLAGIRFVIAKKLS